VFAWTFSESNFAVFTKCLLLFEVPAAKCDVTEKFSMPCYVNESWVLIAAKRIKRLLLREN
jgi:hypothetical protein